MRRAGVAAVLIGDLAVCSHAIVTKYDRHLTAGMDSDAETSDIRDLESADWTYADDDTVAKVMLSLKSNQHIVADFDNIEDLKLVTDSSEDGNIVTDVEENPMQDDLEGPMEDVDRKVVTDVDVMTDVDVNLETDMAGTSVEGDTSVSLSPKARKYAHDAAFETEFTVQVNVSRAHGTGMSMGLELEFETSYQPTRISKVKKNGLLQEWNVENPGKDVHVGDEIVQVNNIKWHHNTPNFVKRIAGQFKAGKDRVAGASEMLSLYIQRPRKHIHKRSQYTREDAHHKAYPVEFDAELPVPRGGLSMDAATSAAMGWELEFKHDWDPVAIGKILGVGVLAAYNRQVDPDHQIAAGDEIVKVNNVSWKHSAATFVKRIDQQFEAFRRQESGRKKTLGLSVRRPRAVYDALLAKSEAKAAARAAAQAQESQARQDALAKVNRSDERQTEAAVQRVSSEPAAQHSTHGDLNSAVQTLRAKRDNITKEISELVRQKMQVSRELAAAEEAVRDAALAFGLDEADDAVAAAAPPAQQRSDPGAPPPPAELPASAAGVSAQPPALPTEPPAVIREAQATTAAPENDDDDVIGGYESAPSAQPARTTTDGELDPFADLEEAPGEAGRPAWLQAAGAHVREDEQ